MTTLLSRIRTTREPPRQPPADVPPLHNGDRLKQPEFHRRYEAMPDSVKAELIGGVVYLSSPVSTRGHGGPHLRLATLLGVYEAHTPVVRAAADSTLVLGGESEPQPDLHLRRLPESGGKTRLDAGGYLIGPPELIVEVAHSTEAVDLHDKRDDYRRAGVPEYLVLCVRERELRAFDLKTGRERHPDPDGIYRSKTFPGLWIDATAVLSGDTAGMLKVLQQGLASPQHAAFVRTLGAKPAGKPGTGGPRGKRKGRGG